MKYSYKVKSRQYWVYVPNNVQRVKGVFRLIWGGEIICKNKSLEYVLLLYQLCYKHDVHVVKMLVQNGVHVKSGGLPRNISRTKNGTYRITKQINNVRRYFGTYKSLEEAVMVRQQLEECGWDFKPSTRSLPEYIYNSGDGYIIIRDGESYGTFRSLEAATVERDLLIRFGWEYDYVDLY